jgi:hypothetical protein
MHENKLLDFINIIGRSNNIRFLKVKTKILNLALGFCNNKKLAIF